jgi:outer membrane protein assembly factor BamB
LKGRLVETLLKSAAFMRKVEMKPRWLRIVLVKAFEIMRSATRVLILSLGVMFGLGPPVPQAEAGAGGWLTWRGPHQTAVSDETGLPDRLEVGGANELWTYDIAGRGEAVVAGDRVYAWGYRGEGPDLREYLICLNALTGEVRWELGFNDFISDIVYDRYSIGAPTVDKETGNIYLMTSPGEMVCVSAAGDVVWRTSMMERFGLLTFPNGRRGAAVIDGDLVIHHAITSYWGADSPARDRFYAFDKLTGDLVWSSTPGTAPKDSSFSTPILTWQQGRRILMAGTGCGNVVAIDARTGDALWRFPLSAGGVNASLLLHNNDKVIAIHGKENLDASEAGRMVAIRLPSDLPAKGDGLKVLDRASEIWRQPLVMFTSSPVLVGDMVYQVTKTGELVALEATSGEIKWSHKLANSQLHASPLYSEGKLYVPLEIGEVHVLRLRDDGVEVLDVAEVEGACLGAPTAWAGRVYVHTTEKLYCFGKPLLAPAVTTRGAEARPAGQPELGGASRLQIVPSDLLLEPSGQASVTVRQLDPQGAALGDTGEVRWAKYIPPTARVKSTVEGEFGDGNSLSIHEAAGASAGMFRAQHGAADGLLRVRVLPGLPFSEDFERFEMAAQYPEGHIEAGTAFSYPPLPWIGARLKWDVRKLEGNKVLAKTLDRVLFQRAITFIGHPNMSEYTVTADVMSDGNRRVMSTVGVINQRYVIALVGNWQQLEVSSNHDRVKVNVPFKWKRGTWYRLKSRVDVAEDGSGVVRAKAWQRDEQEPSDWTIEVPHRVAHQEGAPGLFGFALQSRFKVYVDNIQVASSQPL